MLYVTRIRARLCKETNLKERESQENGNTTAHRVENLDQEIPVVQQIRERELALENLVEEYFIVTSSDSSCVETRCQETIGGN
jgi:hypothetical protein